ncbi:MAG: 6-phosphogluconolactonase [Gemmatimonadota bacterium]
MSRKLLVLDDAEVLADAAAREVTRSVRNAIARRGSCSIALAGGRTPRQLYRKLAGEPHRSRIDWRRLEVFWGDERCVPPDHSESNYRMAREALLDRVPVARLAVHRMRGEVEPFSAAAEYEAALLETLGAAPRLDLVLLGIGADGHTASLFPDTPNLGGELRWVISTLGPATPRRRLSLTLRTINGARKVIFLATGAAKAAALALVLGKAADPAASSLPAALVRPRQGSLVWLVDRHAAARLP